MLDISGSVPIEYVSEFLRQLQPILKESQLFVGFFAVSATKKFVEIKSLRDTYNLPFPTDLSMGTNLDDAVRSFSKDKRIYKIIFTDVMGDMPKPDLANVNVI